jgi:hypothetical protein
VGSRSAELEARVRGCRWLLEVLEGVRESGLPDAWVGAGVIRDLVWDGLHGGFDPLSVKDVDVAFFDPSDLSRERDDAAERSLRALAPDLPWQAKNQAAVHTWFARKFGHAVEPLVSLEDAIGTWPETATSVALALRPDDSLRIVAPYGLDDLFEMVLRRNPRRVSLEEFRRQARAKRITEIWPRVRVLDG